MNRRPRRACWLGAAAAFAALHLALFLPDPVPGAVMWVPAHLSRFIARRVFDDPGTHGFGYLRPRVLITCAYVFAIAVSGTVGYITYVISGLRSKRHSLD